MNDSIFAVGASVYEDFVTNDSITDANVGKELWEIVAISAGADTLTYEAEDGYTFLRMTGTGAGAGDGTTLRLAADKWTFGPTGGFCRFVARIPNITGNAVAGSDFKVGFGSVDDGTEPVVGAWFDCNGGVMECDVASANGDVNTAVSHPDLTSNTTLVLGTWYEFEIRWSGSNSNSDAGPGKWEFYIDGRLVAEFKGPDALLDGAETCEPFIVHINSGATTFELDVMGYEAKSFRQQ